MDTVIGSKAMSFDLKITGGTIVDGTGEPALRRRRRHQGRQGRRAGQRPRGGDPHHRRHRQDRRRPGFVDIHTHYDAQILWDRMRQLLAVARRHHRGDGQLRLPRRADPADRTADLIMRTLENVEGMSARCARRRPRHRLAASRPSRSTSTCVEKRGSRGQRRRAASATRRCACTSWARNPIERAATPDEIAAR